MDQQLIKTKNSVENVVFLDKRTGQQYRRVLGGLAWPRTATDLGVICLLGEGELPDGYGVHHLYVLASTVEATVKDLLDNAAMLNDAYRVTKWLTPTDTVYFHQLVAYNRWRAEQRQTKMIFSTPPEYGSPDLVRFYVTLLHARIKGAKTLHFGMTLDPKTGEAYPKFPHLTNALFTMDQLLEQADDPQPEDHPAIAALMYAMLEMDLNLPSSGPPRPEKIVPEGGY